jgi:uncharacterized membrane protein SirB2
MVIPDRQFWFVMAFLLLVLFIVLTMTYFDLKTRRKD